MTTFYDMIFNEIKEKVEGNGARAIDYDDVDRLVVERSKSLIEHYDSPGCFLYKAPKKPRKTRKDKGVKKGGDRPLEEETTG